MPTGPIIYVTDLEGRWDKLQQALADCPWAGLQGDRLWLHPAATFLFGGDTVDRGPTSLRLVAALVEAVRRMPDQVILLAGNRDINKLRLPRELGDHPLPDFPAARGPRLREILRRTMGAPDAFAHRVAELSCDDEDAVVDSFLAEVAVDTGPLFAYLRAARLGWRWRDVLFVHGGVSPENLGRVPGHPHTFSLDDWIPALDAFLQSQLDAYAADPAGEGHAAIVQYQAPLPGTRANASSVIYARPVNGQGEPRPLDPRVRAALMAAGVRRLVVGHTPTGDIPSVVYDDGFTVLMGDTSYSPLEHGARIELHADHSRIVGAALVDGVVERIDLSIPLHPAAPLGRLVNDKLYKAPLGADWLAFSMGPGFSPVQERRPPPAG